MVRTESNSDKKTCPIYIKIKTMKLRKIIVHVHLESNLWGVWVGATRYLLFEYLLNVALRLSLVLNINTLHV